MSPTDSVLLQVQQLKKYFPLRSGIMSRITGYVYAVDDVSFALKTGETLGLVGESGCGKSTVARLLLRLIEPTAGEVIFDGKNIYSVDRAALRQLRRQMQIIFQDPYSSLNPRMTIMEIVGEALSYHKIATGKEKKERVQELLARVGLRPEHSQRYPHEFSGGQRQRIGIARALALKPKLIIGDEPVSALDVSIQAQVLNLLLELQTEFHLTYLIIAHDLRVVEHISDRVAVMYLGRIVEMAEAKEIYQHPLHPYTQALLSAIPIPDPNAKRQRILLPGDIPSPISPPPGCRFHTRCHYRMDICDKAQPEYRVVGENH
ncbi:MAG: dipeptide ABC transporter ATP-binding protein, partial [candidate division KSB1 bacterium]|nr:dipeptide ABC transporter ATP-binding protein [candidate division KSB1 bacterium]